MPCYELDRLACLALLDHLKRHFTNPEVALERPRTRRFTRHTIRLVRVRLAVVCGESLRVRRF